MPRYSVQCDACEEIHDFNMTYDTYDSVVEKDFFSADCPNCGVITSHRVVLTEIPAVEWRTNGAYSYDNAPTHVKWQRENVSESGTRNDVKKRDRRHE